MNEAVGNLLIVDDNEMNRDMLSRRLSRRGHIARTAESGRQAIEMIGQGEYDTILLDIMMPEMDGLEVLKILRKEYTPADLPIIMVTAKNQSDDIVEALEAGANDYVTKPLDFPVVLARLRTQIALKRMAEAKDQFLRIASHDLKNPLSLVLGAASTLPELTPVGAVMTAEVHNLLGKIHLRALEMRTIIEDFLDFQALSDGQIEATFEPASLDAIAREVVEANGDYAKSKDIDLTMDLEAEIPKARADRAKMGQVMQNLVGNAIKFSPPDTRVDVRARAENGRVVIEVCDSGPGLTQEDLKKTFARYARLSNKPTGNEKSSGLGLHICKQLMELQGGEIGVRNNPDKGATFWVSVPAAKED